MNKEQKVISQSLAKKIHDLAKEKGFELPESEMYYASEDDDKFILTDQTNFMQGSYPDVEECEYPILYPAYDTSELGEMLPNAEALGEMILYLLDNDLL